MRRILYPIVLAGFTGSIYLSTFSLCHYLHQNGWRVEIRRDSMGSYGRCLKHEQLAAERLGEMMVRDRYKGAGAFTSTGAYLAALPAGESGRRMLEPYLAEIKASLAAADEVDIMELNAFTPGLGSVFASSAREGLRNIYFGLRDQNPKQAQKGLDGLSHWHRYISGLRNKPQPRQPPELREMVRADVRGYASHALEQGLRELRQAHWPGR